MSEYNKMDLNNDPNIFGCHITCQTNIWIYLEATYLPNKSQNIFILRKWHEYKYKYCLRAILFEYLNICSDCSNFGKPQGKISRESQKAAPRTSHRLLRCQVVFTKICHYYYCHYYYCHFSHYYYRHNWIFWILQKFSHKSYVTKVKSQKLSHKS